MSKAELNVLERRLRPIYDALDGHNYKKSMQECEKVLKKHPNTAAAKVLKALTLIRLDKLSEAMEILEVLDVDGAKHDDLTLQAFVHCYRDSNQSFRIVNLYERVCAIEPTENNLSQLFMAYTKDGKYKEQQKIGLRLFKEFGNTPYYFWSVMSLIMQAQENPELGKKMLLPLADKMFKTQIEKTGYTEGSSAETELQLLILEGMEKWAECAEFMEKPQATTLPLAPYNLVERGLEYMIKDGNQWEKVDECATTAIEEMSDNWNLWTILVDSAVTQIQKLLEEPEKKENLEAAKNHVKRIADLIELHQKKVEWKCRGPYLANFLALRKFNEMPKKIEEFGDFSGIFGKIVEKMEEYVQKFYRKPVCFSDLQLSFKSLTAEQKTEFLKKLQDWIREVAAEDDGEDDESKIWAIILVERCRRALGDYEKLDAAAHRSLFQQCIAQIAAPGRSDHAQGVLCNLTCAHLWDAYRKDNDLNRFYEMVLLLEYVATTNKTDPVCKLALVRAYSALCNTGRITALVKTLDIKAIQLDTLGHMTFPVFETSGRFNLAIITNTQLSMMYDAAEREVQDCIAQAYRNGKFSAIPRMTAVSRQMKFSAQKTACEVLNRYLSSLFVLDDLDQITVTLWGDDDPIGEKKIDWKQLIDTRDFNCIPHTETEDYEALLDDMKKRTYKELLDISELRSALCRALGAVGRVSYVSEDPRHFQLTRVQLKMTVMEYKKHLEYCVNEYPSFLIPSKLAQSPAPHHLSQWVHSGGPQMVLEYLEAAVKLVEILDAGEHPNVELVGNRTEMAKKLIKLIEVQPKRIEGEKLPPFWVVDPIIRSSRALQTIAAVQVVLRLIEKMVLKLAKNVPTGTPKAKGKKEKKAAEEAFEKVLSAHPAVVFLEHIRSMHVELRYAGNFLHSHFSQMMGSDDAFVPIIVGEDLGKAQMALNQMRPSVDSRIERSFLTAFEDMHTTIKSRF